MRSRIWSGVSAPPSRLVLMTPTPSKRFPSLMVYSVQDGRGMGGADPGGAGRDHRQRFGRGPDSPRRLDPQAAADRGGYRFYRLHAGAASRVEAGGGLDEVGAACLNGLAGRCDPVGTDERGLDDGLQDHRRADGSPDGRYL